MDIFENRRVPIGMMRVYAQGYYTDIPMDGTYLLTRTSEISKIEIHPSTVKALYQQEEEFRSILAA